MFHSESQKVRYIIKGLELSKSLFVSSLIIGEPNIGKKTLVQSIFPDAVWVDGKDTKALKNTLELHEEIVIFNFNIYGDYSINDYNDKRVVAIADASNQTTQMDSMFSFIYNMPTLLDRPQDVKYLVARFSKEAQSIFDINSEIAYKLEASDLLDNSHSLKKVIFKQCFYGGVSSDDIEHILYSYFKSELGGTNDYNKFLPIFERPLIQAGLNRYASQLKLSSVLGINRNTLRKKINELRIN